MGRTTLTWEQWKAAVNAALIRKCGMDAEDLPDWRYRDAFENGMAPHKAASRAIASAKKDMGVS